MMRPPSDSPRTIFRLDSEGVYKIFLFMTAVSELQAIRSELLTTLDRVDALIGAAEPAAVAAEPDITALDRTKAIEWILKHNDGPMRPVEIWAELQRRGRKDASKMEVQVTTFDLWQRDRIGKISRGQYIAKS